MGKQRMLSKWRKQRETEDAEEMADIDTFIGLGGNKVPALFLISMSRRAGYLDDSERRIRTD